MLCCNLRGINDPSATLPARTMAQSSGQVRLRFCTGTCFENGAVSLPLSHRFGVSSSNSYAKVTHGGLIRCRVDLPDCLSVDQTSQNRTLPILSLAGIVLLTAILFRAPLKAALSLSFQDDRYLQIALAPLMCLFLMYWERARIFPQSRLWPRIGLPLLAVAVLFALTQVNWRWTINDGARLASILFAVVLVWMAAFVLCYGPQSFRKAFFALCCLFLMIPISPALMDWMTAELQQGSAATSFHILRFMGIPVFREGMTFMLPGLTIKVAPECSGIHSWLAFVIVAILATRVCLRSGWIMLTLTASTIPIAIFKNAVRIVVISSLTVYVDRSVISGPLHHNGGPLFALVDLAIFVPLLVISQRWESRRRSSASSGMASATPAVASN